MAENSSGEGIDLGKKIGPLPTWGWVLGLGITIVVYLYYRNKNAASAASSGTTSTSQTPQYVDQTYVQSSPPQASAPPPTDHTGGSTGGSSGSGTITGVGGNSAPPPVSSHVSSTHNYTTASETGSYYIATVKGTGKSYDVNPTKGTVHLLTPTELARDIKAGAKRKTVTSKPIPTVHNAAREVTSTITPHPATTPMSNPAPHPYTPPTNSAPITPSNPAPVSIQHSAPHYTTASQTSAYHIVNVNGRSYDVNPSKGTVHLLTAAEKAKDVAAGAKQITSHVKPVAHPVIHRLSPHTR